MNMWTLAGYLFGLFVGLIVGAISAKAFGTLWIDKSDPERDVYRIDVDDFEGLEKRKRVLLKVRIKVKAESGKTRKKHSLL